MSEVFQRRIDRRRVIQAGSLGAGAALAGLGGYRSGAFAQDATPDASVFDPAVCYTPLGDSEMVQYEAVGEGPFNIALSNSYIGNVWRTQMIQMAQAFVQKPDIAPLVSEFQVNSSGTDDSAQIAAIEDMISNGAQAIVTITNTPGGQANVALGYLLGAAEAGAEETSGIHTDLVRRLEAAARLSPGRRSLPPGFEDALQEGIAAGHEHG